jgi:hypothetical protein
MKKHNYIGLAYQFWNLARESINEMEKLDNKKLIASNYDPNISDEESWKNYEHKTRWNDFNIGVPVLFNFYHGLELFMKGLLQEIGKLNEIQMNHSLVDVFHKIDENIDSLTPEIVELIEYYVGPENPFQDFFESNDGSVNDFYIFLRYPTSKKGENSYTFQKIRGNEQVGLDRFRKIRKGCAELKQSIVNWKTNVA